MLLNNEACTYWSEKKKSERRKNLFIYMFLWQNATENSALKIQNVQRSRNARKKVEAKREEKREQVKQEMDRAALKIQQKQRVRDAKKEVHKKKECKKNVAGKPHSLLHHFSLSGNEILFYFVH
jgi:hypothetical protein